MVKKSLLWIYRTAFTLLWLCVIAIAGTVLVLRYIILPNIDQYKDKIARGASQAVGHNITIGEIKAGWDGLNPHFDLLQVELFDNRNRPALTLGHIETSVSWLSLPLLEPRLSTLVIHKPELTIRRETDGILYIAGISMSGPSRPEFANWLLHQSRIDVLDATVLWQDDLRKAPPLTLNKLNLQITSPAWETLLGHHRFGLTATPSAGSSRPIDLRGNLYGKDVGKLKDWRGTIYGRFEGTDIAAWRNWISYPFDLREGFGAARFWMEFDNGKPENITADVILSKVKTRISKNVPETTLNKLSGRLIWNLHKDGQEIKAEHMKIAADGGLNMQNGKISYREKLVNGKNQAEGKVVLDEIELTALSHYANYLPLSKETLQKLTDIRPVGKLQNVNMRWKGPKDIPEEYSFRSQFSGLGVQAYQNFPGFRNLSGSVDADEKNGSLTINAGHALLDFKNILRWPIPADKLTAQVKWRNSRKEFEVHVNNLAIANPHLTGTINASYIHNGTKNGHLDLTGKFGHANAKFAPFYYPVILGEETLKWLDTSILSGHAENVNVIVKGHLQEFPFTGKNQGLFRVTADIRDGELEYALGWPRIEGIALKMLFEGERMELNANAGHIFGNRIIKSKVSIAKLDAEHPVLDVVSESQGPVPEGIRFVNNSPVAKVTEGFTEGLRTTGDGKLSLNLQIPLDNPDASRIKGTYQIANGSMAGEHIPELTKLNGKLTFTESSLSAQNVGTWLYGGPAQFNLQTEANRLVRVTANGRITDVGLRDILGGVGDRISGSTDWNADIVIQDKKYELFLRSNLSGIASTLPPPLNKTANSALPFNLEKKPFSPSQELISISLGNSIAAKFTGVQDKNTLRLDQGDIAFNIPAETPSQHGISLRGTFSELNLDHWRDFYEKNLKNRSGERVKSPSLTISRIDLVSNTLDVFGRRFNTLKLNGKRDGNVWQFNLRSREMSGDTQWDSLDNGKITARLEYLTVPSATPGSNNSSQKTESRIRQQEDEYPALDIIANEFTAGQKKLGRLELQASGQGNDWNIEKLRIINPDSVLTASGEWHNWAQGPNTRMSFHWGISDMGNALERFGYPDTFKGGEADIAGQLRWPGAPHEFDYRTLSGEWQLDARKGQILKVKPGVGRLFSILSLQNLPRRLVFDFRDVFSSGFTFDTITANTMITRGIMRSDNFRMEGPTALVEMKGETDLQKETQHLFVKVTPYISDSLSLAAFAGGPAVGAAAYIAQKILKDPLNKIVASEYEFTGTWDNPEEVKSPRKRNPDSPGATPLGK